MGAVWEGSFLLSSRKLSQHCMKGWGGSGMGRGFLIIFKEAFTALHERLGWERYGEGFLIIFKEAFTALHEGVGWERYGEGVSYYLQRGFHSIA